MRILIGSDRLDELSGGVTYVLTVAEQLQRLGHEVWLHAPGAPGEGGEARRRGLRVASGPADLAEPPELIYVQDAASAYVAAAAWPSVPQVFCVHSDDWDLSLPPQVQDVVAAVVALHGRVEARARAAAVVPEVVRLTQPIDVTRFRPVAPLADPPSRVLLVSNYVTGDRLALVEDACAAAGLSLRCIGRPFGTATATDHQLYAQSDIVLGKARVVLEAMACGRAVYVYDLNGGDGWVTAETYGRLEADSFGGQSAATATTVESLARDLGAVRRDMGPANRDLVVAGHQATKHAEALVGLFTRVASEAVGPGRGPWLELARMARLQWDTDRLVGAVAEGEALRTELTRVHAEYRKVYAELERVRATASERVAG